MMKLPGMFLKYKEAVLISVLAFAFFLKSVIIGGQVIFTPYSDLSSIGVFWKWLYSGNIINYGEIPLWNPYVLGGAPFVGNPQTGMFNPTHFLYALFTSDIVFGYLFILDILLTGLFTYAFARKIGLDKHSSLISAITFMFSGTVISRVYAGHTLIVDSFVYFPMILLFYEQIIRTKKAMYGVLAGASLSLMFFAGHTQFAFYGIFASGLYFIARLFYEARKGSILKDMTAYARPLIVAAFVFFSLIAVQLLPSLEFSGLTNRMGGLNYTEAQKFSISPEYLITFLIPEFFGSPVNDTYFHKGNLPELSGYVGILPLLFAIIGAAFVKSKFRSVFLGLAAFAILFALGNFGPVFPLFYYFVPGFDLFRAPARFLFVYAFSVSILAGMGCGFLSEAISKEYRQKLEKFGKILGVIGAISVISVILAYAAKPLIISFGQSLIAKNYLLYPKLLTQPLSYWYGFSYSLYSTALKSAAFFAIFFVSSICLISLKYKGVISARHFRFFAVLLILADLFSLGWTFVDTRELGLPVELPDYAQIITGGTGMYRTLDLSNTLRQELAGRNGIYLVNGYDASYLTIYQDFLWLSGKDPVRQDPKYGVYIDILKPHNLNILRLLNTKYIVTNDELDLPETERVYRGGNVSVYEIKNTMPHAFIVRSARVAGTRQEAFDLLQSDNFNITEEIILEKRPRVPLHNAGGFEPVNVSLYSPNRIDLQANLSDPGFLVLSDIWYPGWRAYDNGAKTEIYKADYALRAVYVGSGNHSISFVYSPQTYLVGRAISLVSLALIAPALIFLMRRERRKL